MKKATQKSTPVNLGTKRACPECSVKFYDFGKPDVVCPKCQTKLDEAALNPIARLQSESKKSSKSDKEVEAVTATSDDMVVGESDDVIESVDDLDDDEEDLVEEIDVDDEDEQEY